MLVMFFSQITNQNFEKRNWAITRVLLLKKDDLTPVSEVHFFRYWSYICSQKSPNIVKHVIRLLLALVNLTPVLKVHIF